MTASCWGRELPVRDALLQPLVEECGKDLDDAGIPLLSAPRVEASACLIAAEPRPVRTVADHGIPRICDRNDPRPERDRRPAQVVWVAGAVDALVMVPNDRKVVGDAPQREADSLTFGGVLAHPRELLIVEGSWLQKDRVGDRDLPQIVQNSPVVE